MKIKIIDLLNKIANNEEVPKKIKYKDNVYYLGKNMVDLHTYQTEGSNTTRKLSLIINNEYLNLNDEVEIIDESKKIEKLDVALLGQCDNWLRCPTNKVTKQDVELNPYIIDNIRENTLYFQRKINELIDVVNELKRDN